MTVLVKVDIKDELPPDQECLFWSDKSNNWIIGWLNQELNSVENDNELLEGITHWGKEVVLPTIKDLRCIATDQANLNGEVDKIDYLEGFIKASEYILSLLKSKNQ